MSEQRISIVYYPQFFPCGPQSSCCGPVGQTEEEMRSYVESLQAVLPEAQIQLIDATDPQQLQSEPAAARLLSSFGPAGCPIFTVNGQVVAMGQATAEQLVDTIKQRVTS